jgi:DNA-binding transcriptional LysR family regulator
VPGKAPRDWTTIARLRKQSTFIGYKPDSFIGRDIGSYLQAQNLELPTHHEFDSSASVLSMVRAGFGWAITTPLSVLSNFSDATDIRYHRIVEPPGPRRLAVFSADKHNDQLYQRVARSARNVLTRHHRERLEQLCPWWDWERAGLTDAATDTE